MSDLDDDLIISKIEKMLSKEIIYFPSNIQVTISEEDSKIIITLLDKYLTLRLDSIPKQKIRDLIENETINISGFECIAVEDLKKLLKEKTICQKKKRKY